MHGFERKLATIALAMLAAAGCATTKFASTWKDPAAQSGELQGKRVAAFVVSDQEATRRSGEEALARALKKHGLLGIPGYELATSDELADRARLQRKLEGQKIDAMVLMRIVGTREVVTYPGLNWPYDGYFRSTMYSGYGGYGYGWYGGAIIATEKVVTVETMVYSLPDNNLLWAGVSDTVDPRKLDWMIGEVAGKATKEMKKQGLIVR